MADRATSRETGETRKLEARATGAKILFNETQSRVVISVVRENAETVLLFAKERGVPAFQLGTVGGDTLEIAAVGETLRWPLPEIHGDWYDAIANALHVEELVTA